MGVGVSGGGDGATLRLHEREQISEFDLLQQRLFSQWEVSQVEVGNTCSTCEVFDFDLSVRKGRDDFKFCGSEPAREGVLSANNDAG